ncbi:MAG: GNAT family N-acetyltransferase [Bacteroidales bacterium]
MSKVQLRAIEPADIDLLYEWENNSEVWGAGNTLAPLSRWALQQHIAEMQTGKIFANEQVRLIIDLVEEQTCNTTAIGTADLSSIDAQHLRAEVGILIYAPILRGKGYGYQALELLTDYAFNTLQLHQLYCSVAQGNRASVALFSKSKVTQTGIRRAWRKTSKGFEDEVFMQRLRD